MAKSKRVFPTQFDDHDRVRTAVGSRMKTLYAPRFDENGVMELQEKGQEDFYAYIQSHRDSVDINVLLKRFENGEVDVLSRVQGAYGDFSQMPTTYAELLNAVNEGHQMFDSLPVETRAKFHHSFSEFMAAMDSPDFWKLMGLKDDQPADGAAGKVDKAEDTAEVKSSES